MSCSLGPFQGTGYGAFQLLDTRSKLWSRGARYTVPLEPLGSASSPSLKQRLWRSTAKGGVTLWYNHGKCCSGSHGDLECSALSFIPPGNGGQAFEYHPLMIIDELCTQNALERRHERAWSGSALLGTMTEYSLERWQWTTFLEPMRMMAETEKGKSKPSTMVRATPVTLKSTWPEESVGGLVTNADRWAPSLEFLIH